MTYVRHSIAPRMVERSTLLVAASAMLVWLVFVWQPMPNPVWQVAYTAHDNVI